MYIQFQIMHGVTQREISNDSRDLGSNPSTGLKFLTFMLSKHQIGPKLLTSASTRGPELLWKMGFLLDSLLAGPGGLCAVTNTPCCTWVNTLNQEERSVQNFKEKATWLFNVNTARDTLKGLGTYQPCGSDQSSCRNGIFGIQGRMEFVERQFSMGFSFFCFVFCENSHICSDLVKGVSEQF